MHIASREVRKLALELAFATDENAVHKIVQEHPVLRTESNWKPYGGYDTNFNTVNNQAKHPIAALVEKPVNSIDALLLKECKLRGINPRGSNAPKNMFEAAEQFFGIKNGDFRELTDKQRREIASNIMIIADGSDVSPNITVADKGEGQNPEDFETTLVSLHGSNKKEIPFVQGKYHMGGSGVLPFCGKYKYQLILSRKTPELLQKGQKDLWGLSLVRLHFATGSYHANSWFEYCVDPDGKILSFPGEPLEVLPDQKTLENGTFIKLFNYELPSPAQITTTFWRELHRYLYNPPLPVQIYELRPGYEKIHGRSRVVIGNKQRVLIDAREKVENRFAITAELGNFGKRLIEVVVFSQEINKSEYTTPSDAIFFTINGQTHATLGRSFLKTKANLHYLADYMLVHIDCSELEIIVSEFTFMPSRDRMRDNASSKAVEESLADELKKHEGLRALNQQRREAQIVKNTKDEKFLENVISGLLKVNPSLLTYLGLGGRIKPPVEPPKPPAPYVGRQFPTYLRIKGFSDTNGNYIKKMPVNSFSRLLLETDVVDEYLNREEEKGILIISPDLAKSFHLYHGLITLKLVPPKDSRVGQKEKVRIELTHPYSENLFVEFLVEYAPEIEPRINPPRPPSPQPHFNLPPPTLVYKFPKEGAKTWAEMDPPWTEKDIGKVNPSGENGILDIFVNMDALNLHAFLRRQAVSPKKVEFIKRAWKAAIYLKAMILYNDLKKKYPEEVEDLIPIILESDSKIVLDLICNETFLKELEE